MVKMPRFETSCLETGVKTLVTETGQQLPPSNVKNANPELQCHEGQTRGQMNTFLKEAGIRDGDLLIQSDVDEIPRSDTVQLFQWCKGMPKIVHLDMTAYIFRYV